jgi:hypothetical protein
MNKIRIKTGNTVPSDSVIDSHKNFDQLMNAYQAAPAVNGATILGKKLLLFGTGLITGIVTTVVIVQSLTDKDVPAQHKAEQEKIVSMPTETQVNEANTVPFVQPSSGVETTGDSQVSTQHAVNAEANTAQWSAPGHDAGELIPVKPEVRGSAYSEIDTIKKGANQAKVATKLVEINLEKQDIERLKNKLKHALTDTIAFRKRKEATAAGNRNTVNDKSPVVVPSESKTDTIVNNRVTDQVADTSAKAEDRKVLKLNLEKENLDRVKEKLNKAGKMLADTIRSGAKKLERELDKKKGKQKTDTVPTGSIMKDSATRSFSGNKNSVDDLLTKADSIISAFKKTSDDQDSAAADSYVDRPFQVSFVTPMSTNGTDGGKYAHHFSLNIIQGYSGGLKGLEVGGIANIVKGYAKGAQVAGISNYAGGKLTGLQAAGIVNVSKGVLGGQFAGIANLSRGYLKGIQGAGIVNVCVDSFAGAQFAGIINLGGAKGTSRGFQGAGIANIAAKMDHGFQAAGIVNFRLGDSKGAQIAGIANIAKNLDGAQIGLINVAKNVKGLQLGLINISENNEGVPIGLFTFVKNGHRSVDIWSGDAMQLNLGFKSGSKKVYNIYGAGLSFNGGNKLSWGAGMGLGTHFTAKTLFMDVDVMSWSINSEKLFGNSSGINLLNQFRLMGGKTFSDKVGVYAGPSFNVLVHDTQLISIAPYTMAEYGGPNTLVKMWVGLVAGVQLF